LQQSVLAHQPLDALAVHRRLRLSGRERSDHPGAVGGIVARDVEHDPVGGVQRPPLSTVAAAGGAGRSPGG
jgi:hypothetical protein